MITVDYPNRIISIPKVDMPLVQMTPFEIHELNCDTLRLALKDIEDGEEGMFYPDTHRTNAPVTVGGTTLARVLEIINGFTITFENLHYAVNVVGANSNIGDVMNLNDVSVRTANSAGLVVTTGGSGASAAEVWQYATRTLTASALTTEQNDRLNEIWAMHGLDIANPLIVNATQRVIGSIIQSLTTVGPETTVQRL